MRDYIVWAILLCGGSVMSQETSRSKLIPRKIIFGNPEKTAATISPDGRKLAYIAPVDNVLNVWVRTVGAADDTPITSDTYRGIRSYQWRPDSKHILYQQDKGGDENFHLFQTNVEDRTTIDLTPFEGARVQGIYGNLNHPDEILVGLNVRDKRIHDIYRVNLKTGAADIDTTNPGNVSGWDADNDLVVRVAEINQPDGSWLYRVRENPQAPWTDFTVVGADESFGGVKGFTPDNKSVYWASSAGANASRLQKLDLSTSASSIIAEDPEYDIESVLTNPRTHELEGYRFVRERRQWSVIEPGLKQDFEILLKHLDADMEIVSRSYDDKHWIVLYLMDSGPAAYYHYDRTTKKPTFLFSTRPKLDAYKHAKMQPVVYTARDGTKIHGYLTRPNDPVTTPPPLVLFVHGGPWGRDVWGWHNDVQWLANRGYAVLQINFRGSTGYGKKFLNAGDREWGGKMHTDLIDGKQWAIQNGHADPAKTAIYGGSYGGYAVLCGLAFTPEEFACGVNVVGVSNIITFLNTIPPYWEPARALFRKRVGDAVKDEEFLKSRSPFFSADRITKPLLIAHGANDPRVKQSEADQIVAAMRKNNKPVDYLVFPDEGHGFARPQNRLKFYAAAEAFLAKYLGGRAEPPAPDEASDDLRK